MKKLLSILSITLSSSLFTYCHAQFSNLVNFTGNDVTAQYIGDVPQGDLTPSVTGDTLFGMTKSGGAAGNGNIFSIKKDGTGFTDLLDFTGTTGSYIGNAPQGSLTLSVTGDTLFGMTQAGGPSGLGNIFSVRIDGSDFNDMINFTGASGSYIGRIPTGNLTFSITKDTLFGMTYSGGSDFNGNIFSVQTNAANFKDVADFTGTSGSYLGANPQGSLTLSVTGDTLFGMTTTGGGTSSDGTIFSIQIDGTHFDNMADFNGTNGLNPYGSLTFSITKDTLFGMTYNGGTSGVGNIFSIQTNGNNFSDLLDFDGGAVNAEFPTGSLTLSVTGDSLFGMTTTGGTGSGNIFVFQPNGAVYTDFIDFSTWGSYEGGAPFADVTLIGKTLFGTTQTGGATWGDGNIFSVQTDGTNFNDMLEFNNFTDPVRYGRDPDCSLTPSITGDTLFGTTFTGGAGYYGTIFSVRKDGSNLNTMVQFSGTGGSYSGQSPIGAMLLSVTGDTLFGITQSGGPGGNGNIFSVRTDGTNFSDVVDFTGTSGAAIGKTPVGSLTFSITKDTLFGMTNAGGITGDGNVFSVKTDGTQFSNMHNCSPGTSSGEQPEGSLTLSITGDTLFGMTEIGGAAYSVGNIFSIQTNGNNYNDMLDFTGSSGSYKGGYPLGGLTLSITGDTLFGMTSLDGSSNNGTVFSVKTDGSDFNTMLSFSGTSGAYLGKNPYGDLTLVRGILYGFTQAGGVSNKGNMFSVHPDGTSYTNLKNFNGASGQSPRENLTRIGNVLYGTTYSGGTQSDGTIFSYTLPAIPLTGRAIVNHNATACANIGQATASPTEGILPYTYSWSPGGQTTASISGLSGGTYTVTITDGVDSIVTATATIIKPLDFAPTISKTSVTCNGTATGSATVSLNTIITENYSFTGAVQNFTVPAGITILTINVAGAAGAVNEYSNEGRGASFAATCSVTPGHVISVVVGGQGQAPSPADYNAGGGGGTFVYDSTTTTILAIGGGGGGGDNAGNGGIDLIGNTCGTGNNSFDSAQDGTGGLGGGTGQAFFLSTGNGGAGWLGNGLSGTSGNGGNDRASGFAGGVGPAADNGGYGGGGSGDGDGSIGNGGGGGYNGGKGGIITTTDGGGSYLNGTLIGTAMDTTSGNGVASIRYTASQGTAPYTYTWSDAAAQTTATATNLSAGTYSVTIQDNGGCSVTPSVTIIQPLAFAPIISKTGVTCNGTATGSATVSLGTIDTFNYSYSGAVQNFTVPAGITTLTVTLAGGQGSNNDGSPSSPGANGANFKAICTVIPGHVISVAVGQQGGNDGGDGGGGGGGTFIYDSTTTTLLAVAGGGGGSSNQDDEGGTGGTDIIGNTNPPGSGSAGDAADGISGNGGDVDISSIYVGTGGAGWLSDGVTVPFKFAALDRADGFAGGNGFNSNVGGYGGGGAGGNSGGGGGGYNGGGGGNNLSGSGNGGDGGASYLNGTVIGSVTANNTGNGSAAIQYSTIQGTAPYTYAWTDGATQHTPTATNLAAGTYSVSIQDINGCSATAGVTITAPAVFGSSVCLTTSVSCNGGSDGTATARLHGGTLPYTYLWSDGASQATATATGLSAGTYSVNISDANGCAPTTVTATVLQPSVFGASTCSTTSVSCNGGSDGTATARPYGGTSPYIYLWGGGASTASISGLSVGTYTITITDHCGVSATSSAKVIQPTVFGASTCSTTSVSCNGGSDGTATARAYGGTSPYIYLWGGGASTATVSGLSMGTYTITITDHCGVSATSSATVIQPTVFGASTCSTTSISCNGGSDGTATARPYGGTSPYIYLWGGGASTATVSGLSVGTYTITITDHCGVSATSSAKVIQPTVFGASTCSTTSVSCNGGSDGTATARAYGGTSPYIYLWGGGASTVTVSGLSVGTYTVTITDHCGVSATSSATVIQPTAFGVLNSLITSVSCNGGSDGTATARAYGGTSPYIYLWGGGASTATVSGLSVGTYTITITDHCGVSATSSAKVIQPTVFGASTCSTTSVSCNGGSDGTATARAYGGTSPYIYLWGGGASTATVSGLSVGTYTITITDHCGVSATSSATVIQPTVFGASTCSTTSISCNGGSDGTATARAYGGTSPYIYLWGGGASTVTVSGLSVGTYTVTITDHCGVSATSSATVIQPTVFGASTCSTTSVSCNGGSDGTATARPYGGTSPYIYLWGGGASTVTVSGLSVGTYTITITDHCGVSATSSATVIQPTVFGASTCSTTSVSCNGGSDGTATARAYGGTSPYIYLWGGGASTVTVSGLSVGTYTVKITDHCGVSATSSATVIQPTVFGASTCSTTSVSCNGGSDGTATARPYGGTSPYIYLWGGGASTATVSGLSVGTYTITITDHCGVSATSSATVIQPTVFGASTCSTTSVSCNGGSDGTATARAYGGTSPYIYLWGGGASTATVSGLSVGTYTITITDHCGVSATSSAKVIQPTVFGASTCSTTSVSCNGGSDGTATARAYGGTSPYIYLWGGGASTVTVSGLSVGTYTITITDHCGVSATSSATVIQPSQLIATLKSQSCNAGAGIATVSGVGGTPLYSYAWTGGGSNATMTGLSNGTYTITVTDHNNCSATTSVVMTCNVASNFNDPQQPKSVCCPEELDINVYPNPNSGMFTLSGVNKDMIVEIYDYTGKMISRTVVNDETMRFNLYKQAAGVYLLRVLSKDGVFVGEKKVVKTE